MLAAGLTVGFTKTKPVILMWATALDACILSVFVLDRVEQATASSNAFVLEDQFFTWAIHFILRQRQL